MPEMDYEDRLIHILLGEVFGGDETPDLTRRIMARAGRGWRMRYLVPALAAAAIVAVALVGWHILAPRYPEPEASGAYAIVGGEELGRGVALATEQETAELTLGGYCRVALDAQTTLRIEGDKFAEQVTIDRGSVTCDIESQRGSFVVRSEVGIVSVKGTQFEVRMLEPELKGDGEMEPRKMFVRVMVGMVLVAGSWGQATLQAGDEKAFSDEGAKGGMVTGIVTAEGDTWLEVRAEGEKESRRYLPRWIGKGPEKGGGFDEKMLKAFKHVYTCNLVQLKWMQEEHRRVLAIRVIRPSAKAGIIVGTVTAKSKGCIDVKPAKGYTERYMARWTGGMPADGGGLDKKMIAVLRKIEVGDQVKLHWITDERKRVVRIEVLAADEREKDDGLEHEEGEGERDEKAEHHEETHGVIHTGEPKYVGRDGPQWKHHGRLVGHLRDAPVCEIDVVDGKGRVVKSTRVRAGAKAYELEWLPPGEYILRIAAKGCKTLEKPIVIKAKHDLFVDLECERDGDEGKEAGEGDEEAEHKASDLPEGVHGFSGMVRGTVLAKGEKHTFLFKVHEVLKVWENNKAKHPKALAGKTVNVGPRWVKGEGGKWRPNELHVAFIKKLEVGHEGPLEIKNSERDHFAILELSGEQREQARQKGE